MSSNGNSAAYPQQLVEDRHGDYVPVGDSGLTKRELIAAMAMQSLGCPFEWLSDDRGQMHVRIRVEYPRLAVEYADALLAALQANGGEA